MSIHPFKVPRANMRPDQLPDMTYRACPHCHGKNTGYLNSGFGEGWFTTREVERDGGSTTITVYACGDQNRQHCPHLNSKQ